MLLVGVVCGIMVFMEIAYRKAPKVAVNLMRIFPNSVVSQDNAGPALGSGTDIFRNTPGPHSISKPSGKVIKSSPPPSSVTDGLNPKVSSDICPGIPVYATVDCAICIIGKPAESSPQARRGVPCSARCPETNHDAGSCERFFHDEKPPEWFEVSPGLYSIFCLRENAHSDCCSSG